MWGPHTPRLMLTLRPPTAPEPREARGKTAPAPLRRGRLACRELRLKVGSDRMVDKDMLEQFVDAFREGAAVWSRSGPGSWTSRSKNGR